MKFLPHKYIQKIKTYAIAHKVISAIVVIVVCGIGYVGYGKLTSTAGEARYVLATVEKGTVVASVTGSGQVSAFNQLDIKPKVSADVVWVGVKAGQSVLQRQALFSLDATDAQKAVLSAELDLALAKLQIQKDTAQAPVDYARELELLDKAKADLVKTYEDTFNTISGTFLSIPSVMTGIQDILYGEQLSGNTSQWNVNYMEDLFIYPDDKTLVKSFGDIAERDYKTARNAYDKNFIDFKNITRYSDNLTLEKLLQETLDTTKAIAQATKSETNLLDTIVDIAQKKNRRLNSLITTFQSNLNGYIGTINSNLTSELSEQSSLTAAKLVVSHTEQDIGLLHVNNPNGDTPLSLQVSQNNIKKQESALENLKTELANHTVYAPFSGIIAKVNVKKGDSVSAGTAVATLITKQKIAEITLNEVDVSKIKVGQKVTITFDAIDALTLTGEVGEIDSLGTVSQGVVTYAIKITFDTQEDRVKPGMSVNTAIITDVKQNVLIVPNSALKSQGGIQYVQLFDTSLPAATSGNQGVTSAVPPRQQMVETGLANDTSTEIISGLKEGDQVVTRTITASATSQTAAQAPNLLGAIGGNRSTGGGAGATRVLRGD